MDTFSSYYYIETIEPANRNRSDDAYRNLEINCPGKQIWNSNSFQYSTYWQPRSSFRALLPTLSEKASRSRRPQFSSFVGTAPMGASISRGVSTSPRTPAPTVVNLDRKCLSTARSKIGKDLEYSICKVYCGLWILTHSTQFRYFLPQNKSQNTDTCGVLPGSGVLHR